MKPRVAIFAGMFREKSDGSARSLIELSKSLSKQGIEHQVFSPCVEAIGSDFLKAIEISSIPIFFYPEYRIGFFSQHVKQQLKDFKPDIIHVATPDLVGHAAVKFAKKQGIPAVASFHTHFPSYLPYYKLGFLQPWLWKKLKKHYQQCEVIFTPTKVIVDELFSHGITGKESESQNSSLKIWSRGINKSMFSKNMRSQTLREAWGGDEKFYVLFAGRLVWYKNLDCVQKVYMYIQKYEPELFNQIKFCFAGDGPAKSVLQKQMSQAHFFGSVKPEKIGAYFASCDALFFPSITETFGQVVQEALASGIPAMVSNQGGCQEIIKASKAGYIFDHDDVKAYSASIKELVVDIKKRQTLQDNALIYAETKQWDRVNQVVIDVYMDLMKKV